MQLIKPFAVYTVELQDFMSESCVHYKLKPNTLSKFWYGLPFEIITRSLSV